MVFTKFTIGYPIGRADGFIDEVIRAKDRIHEVYFAMGDLPHGRGFCTDDDPEPAWERTKRLTDDLGRLHAAGIGLDLLLNGNCYGADALSRRFFNHLGDSLDRLIVLYGVGTVTTTSPLIGKFIHDNFPDIDVRASVNMGIGERTGFDYVSEFFDSFYLKREYNRCFDKLEAALDWCRREGKKLFLLANSGCLNDCSAHTFHDNLVAHEAEIETRDNAYVFSGICRDYLRNPDKALSIVRDCNYIRPEDVRLYEGKVSAVKLATRVSRNPGRVLASYLAGRYIGPVTDLLEPDNGSALLPAIVDNSRFPSDFGERVLHCAKNCTSCSFCESVYRMARVDLSEMQDVLMNQE